MEILGISILLIAIVAFLYYSKKAKADKGAPHITSGGGDDSTAKKKEK